MKLEGRTNKTILAVYAYLLYSVKYNFCPQSMQSIKAIASRVTLLQHVIVNVNYFHVYVSTMQINRFQFQFQVHSLFQDCWGKHSPYRDFMALSSLYLGINYKKKYME